MTNFIPIFPLGIAVFPYEKLNLHIFEPRYKQLINDTIQSKKPFGIPVVLNGKISEIGTLVEVVEISKTYENGEMDIKTRGISIFNILEIIREIPEKLYSGAIVSYPTNNTNAMPTLIEKIKDEITLLHNILTVNKTIQAENRELLSYDFAHHIGMTIEDEYTFMQLMREDQRLEWIRRHLKKVIPILTQMEELKSKIRLNGHFRNLEGFEFE
jgi:Lon protease-like protein